MSFTAGQIKTIVSRDRLNDPSNTTYASETVLSGINVGQLAIMQLRPDATRKRVVHQLSAGTRQEGPSDCHRILDVVRNTNFDDSQPDSVVRLVDREVLDAAEPQWHADSQSLLAYEWMFDDRQPTQFWVAPPSSGSGYVELLYSAVPATIDTDDDAIELPDAYVPALIEYVVYYVLANDDDLQMRGEADRALASFGQMLTGKAQADQIISPKTEAQLQ